MRKNRQATRRNDPAGLRRRILDAAFGMFQLHGYNGTSMQDLMQVIGVSGGALHHHFATKKALALAVFRERVRPVVGETWIEPVRAADSLGAAVQSVFDDIAAGIEAHGGTTGCPLNNLAMELSLADRDFRDAAGEIFREWREVLAQKTRASRAGRNLRKEARLQIADFVVSAYSGAMALARAQQSAAPLRNAGRMLGRWLESRRLE